MKKRRDPEWHAYKNSINRAEKYIYDESSSTMNQFDKDMKVIEGYMEYSKKKKKK